jgi:Adenomatosis polyposis coli down-regulated 1
MFMATLLALCLAAVSSVLAAQPQTAPAILGVWESERCVAQERGGVRTGSKSVFIFLDHDWALEFVQFADDQCARPTMKAFFAGQYEITQRSAVVAGANDATFGFSHKVVTFYDESLLAEANRGVCGPRMWKHGQPNDVSATGCLWVTPVSACQQEFDLVKIEGNRLFLGERPQPGRDLCREDRRAQQLRSLALIRR